MLSDAQAQQIWQQWLNWLPAAPPIERPAPIFALYRKQLLEAGISEAEADQYHAVIVQRMRTQTDGWRVLFNNIYSSPTPGFSTSPNALLLAAVEGRVPGRALDICTGQGRNAVFLAIRGWDVTALDISDEGLRVAAGSANRAGVALQTVLQSSDAFDFGMATWDLIVVTYAPVPLTLPAYVERVRESLRPGGLVVIESFASDAAAPARRPVDIDPEDLRRAFGDFKVAHFEDTVAVPDWDSEATRLTRFIAIR
ncbi:MAG: class I SAM-dependent methyltransferase [Cytophagales bacterium]|nr:class I SAM-dependent methyltransferase [Armatimonadota bacterium]